jgi:hypothetical protein
VLLLEAPIVLLKHPVMVNRKSKGNREALATEIMVVVVMVLMLVVIVYMEQQK